MSRIKIPLTSHSPWNASAALTVKPGKEVSIIAAAEVNPTPGTTWVSITLVAKKQETQFSLSNKVEHFPGPKAEVSIPYLDSGHYEFSVTTENINALPNKVELFYQEVTSTMTIHDLVAKSSS